MRIGIGYERRQRRKKSRNDFKPKVQRSLFVKNDDGVKCGEEEGIFPFSTLNGF